MKIHLNFIKTFCLFFIILILGCGNKPEVKNNSNQKAKDHHDDHHDDHHNDHDKGHKGHDEKGHEHVAPNGGALVELGEEFAHLELVNDVTNNKIICYVFDGSLKIGYKAQQSSIKATIKGSEPSQEIEFKSIINELASNTAESSSHYEADFKFEKGKKVTLIFKNVTVKGKTFENIESTLNEIN